MKHMPVLLFLLFCLACTNCLCQKNVARPSATNSTPATVKPSPVQTSSRPSTAHNTAPAARHSTSTPPAKPHTSTTRTIVVKQDKPDKYQAPAKGEHSSVSKPAVTTPPAAEESTETLDIEETRQVATPPTARNSNQNLYNNFWKEYRIRNYGRAARKSHQHCGCAGDISIVNETSDTLDVFFRYLDKTDAPTLPGQTIPSVSNKRLLSDFYIMPFDTVTFRGVCSGSLQYEATTRKAKGVPRQDIFTQSGYVRMNCMNKMIYLRKETTLNEEH